jgi:putative endonuclease
VNGYYRVHVPVYYESTESIEGARIREKQMKEWERRWKIELIEKRNPDWVDLYDGLG